MKKLISIFCVLILISIPVTAKAEDRSFDITGLAINAIITEDGNIEVNEELTYDFSGEFNGILRNYSSNGANGIEISKVYIRDKNNNLIELTQDTALENRYEIIDSYEGNQVKIYSKSLNEPKTFIIDYTVVGGVKKYEEYGELNWNFYSVENGNNVHKVDFKLALKDENFNPDILQYWYYADGGDFSTSYSEKQIEVMGYDLSTMLGVEARFQPEFLTDVPITDSNVENEYVPSDEEWQYDYVDNNQSDSGIVVLVVLAIGGGVAGLYAAHNRKYKKAVEEYRRNYMFFNSDYIDSPPSNLPPALVNLLYREKGTTVDILATTLFYLYNKGYYTRTTEDDFSTGSDENIGFKRTTKELKNEYKHLIYFVNWMSKYNIDGVISLENIKEEVSTEKGTRYFREKMSKWQNTIKEDGKKLGFYTTIENRETLVNEYYDEKLKWLAYRKYIVKSTEYNDFININDINTLLIYAMALEIKEIQSDEFSIALNNISNNNTTHFHNYNRMNDYSMFFINYHMWNTINSSFYHHNDSSNIGNSNFSGGDSFGGSFGGGDFSGGGGGGSDAF